jgi:tRNA acetyltransferase TAN1|tara:strand:- start:929 stop:1450 length:522 start_codon:yes stop_codon:yes gene_type:complete
MNLIITCQRNLEDPTILEIQNMLERFGDVDAIIEKTVFSGIIQVQTSLDNIEVIKNFKEIIDDEPWLIKYCSRIIPIQKECESKLEEITNTAIELSQIMKNNETYRITIEKRHSSLHTKEIIFNIADSISNKVSLENSDWEIIVQVLRNKTGISVIPPDTILSVDKEKRVELD